MRSLDIQFFLIFFIENIIENNVLDIYVFISLFSDETGSTEIFLEDVSPSPKVKSHSTSQSALQTNKMFVHVQRLA